MSPATPLELPPACRAAIDSFPVPTGDPHDTCQATSAAFTRHCRERGLAARWLQLTGSPDLALPADSPWFAIPPTHRHHYLTELDTPAGPRFVCFTYRQFDPSAPLPLVTASHGWSNTHDVTDTLDLFK